MISKKVEKVIREISGVNMQSYTPSFFLPYVESYPCEKILSIAQEYGTPQYLFHEDLFRERIKYFIETFRNHFSKVDFFYAFKCNDFPYLIKILKEFGYNADVAGLLELQLAISMGFTNILFTAPGKSDEEIDLSLQHSDKVIFNMNDIYEVKRTIVVLRNKDVGLLHVI